ncbi:MAG TPA: hypothetical protein PKE15_13830 [Ottowia sp.]|nr:hypothetical protein [Ottowia sp.]
MGKSSVGSDSIYTVLENGEVWGTFVFPGTSIVGAQFGNAVASGFQVSGALTEFTFTPKNVKTRDYSGNFQPKQSLFVSEVNGPDSRFTYVSTYDQPASLASVVGSYTGAGASGLGPLQTTSITISSSGGITIPTLNGCAAAGTILPRATGKNVYDVTVTFQGDTCALGNGTTTRGIGTYESSTRTLLAKALNSTKSDGFFFFGTKN